MAWIAVGVLIYPFSEKCFVKFQNKHALIKTQRKMNFLFEFLITNDLQAVLCVPTRDRARFGKIKLSLSIIN